MKRPRPYIPILVRLRVASAQLIAGDALDEWPLFFASISHLTAKQKLASVLGLMFDTPQLDHDPALVLREFNPRTGKYTPDANDPAYLIYREKDEHLQKTTGRKPGAARTITTKGSDIGLRNKFRKLERAQINTSDIPETSARWFKKAKIKSRGFDKQKRTFR